MLVRWKSAAVLAGSAVWMAVLTGCPQPNPNPNPNPNVPQHVLDMELDAHQLVNAQRVAEGLAPLTLRNDLRLVARAHSEDMFARQFFDHENPDGDDPFERMHDAGISFTSAAENIAWNNFPDPAAVAVEGWMNSSGHRANILNGVFTHTGMGVAYDPPNDGYYFTQVFTAGSKDGPWLVVIEKLRAHAAPGAN